MGRPEALRSRAGTPLLLLLSLALVAPARGGEAPAPAGHLLLIGGGPRPPAVMAKFVALAGGPAAPIVVFPTASELADTGAVYERELAALGAERVEALPVHDRRDAARADLVAKVEAAGGIFFSGGDQRRITAALLGTPLGRAVEAAYRRGAVVGGTSAGLACMSELMLTGEGEFDGVRAGAVEVVPGLGLLAGVVLDQHFLARQRLNRLLAVILERPALLGIGVDEATAIWVRPDGTLEVMGESQAVVVDARAAALSRAEAPEGRPAPLGAADVRLHLLLPGDRLDLVSGRPLPR
ncbi:MAG: cyanophycinase [Thermoanaerobaculia bacterium]|nr:cyanophycinase [Thermoanaerobaculia bacterium]MCZ7649726.1 cyanophycinase [Thermoanaerobaculia bacterium]